MSLDFLVEQSQLFFLVFARILVFIEIAPLLSSSAIPQTAKAALAFFAAAAVLPWVAASGTYIIPENGLNYAFMVLGEALIGIILGFFIVIITSVFQVAGEFFSTQMGFASSQVFDPLAQIQIPLIGQFLNLVAMLVLLTVNGFQKLFIAGIYNSFKVVTVSGLLENKDDIIMTLLSSMSGLFGQALVIALPVMGALLLVQVTMGLLAKAAPQMNLLMLSFPINIFTSFIVLFAFMPFLIENIEAVLDAGFRGLTEILKIAGGRL